MSPMVAERISILGVPVTDVTMDDALALVEAMILADPPRTHSVYFVNAHTLNNACDDPSYRDVLAAADCVFGDGTGVRWATRAIHRRQLRDNVNGTDLVPRLLTSFVDKSYSYFLLGTTSERIERAAQFARASFPHWTQTGYHHGYIDEAESERLVAEINEAAPKLLLVGMGNPRQELWIHRHRNRLRVPVCMGIGGLFEYWSGDLDRAPGWMRAIGYEWAHLLLRQPHKAHRYLVGNPHFLMRVAQRTLSGEDRDS